MKYKKTIFDSNKKQGGVIFLAGDVGGTTARLAVGKVKENRCHLIFKLVFQSKNLDFTKAIQKTINTSRQITGVQPEAACIAAAGPVSDDQKHCNVTNNNLKLDIPDLVEKTSLKKGFIINDFKAIGYAVNILDLDDKTQVYTLQEGKPKQKKTKAVVGAGTGLGKTFLTYSEKTQTYTPNPSEGGHSDFPIVDEKDLDLSKYIQTTRDSKYPVTYDDIVSGPGIYWIFRYLKEVKKIQTSVEDEINKSKDKAKTIAKYKNRDEACMQAFKYFTKYYARCCKNYALETLCQNGLYLAGGIASKNPEIFKQNDFLNNFLLHEKYKRLLEEIPIHVIVDQDAGLKGALYAATMKY